MESTSDSKDDEGYLLQDSSSTPPPPSPPQPPQPPIPPLLLLPLLLLPPHHHYLNLLLHLPGPPCWLALRRRPYSRETLRFPRSWPPREASLCGGNNIGLEGRRRRRAGGLHHHHHCANLERTLYQLGKAGVVDFHPRGGRRVGRCNSPRATSTRQQLRSSHFTTSLHCPYP